MQEKKTRKMIRLGLLALFIGHLQCNSCSILLLFDARFQIFCSFLFFYRFLLFVLLLLHLIIFFPPRKNTTRARTTTVLRRWCGRRSRAARTRK